MTMKAGSLSTSHSVGSAHGARALKHKWISALQLFGMMFLIAGLTAPGWAQTFPNRPIRLVLPFPPGGSTDILGRVVAQNLSERLGQPVIADNRPGLGGYYGLEMASKANPLPVSAVTLRPAGASITLRENSRATLLKDAIGSWAMASRLTALN